MLRGENRNGHILCIFYGVWRRLWWVNEGQGVWGVKGISIWGWLCVLSSPDYWRIFELHCNIVYAVWLLINGNYSTVMQSLICELCWNCMNQIFTYWCLLQRFCNWEIDFNFTDGDFVNPSRFQKTNRKLLNQTTQPVLLTNLKRPNDRCSHHQHPCFDLDRNFWACRGHAKGWLVLHVCLIDVNCLLCLLGTKTTLAALYVQPPLST